MSKQSQKSSSIQIMTSNITVSEIHAPIEVGLRKLKNSSVPTE